MQFTSTIMTLALCASGALAFNDVYARFLTSGGAQVGSTTYDVSNTHCFLNSGSVQVSFSQEDTGLGAAKGPYCLSGYTDSNCNNFQGNQQFANVDNTGGQKYALNGPTANNPYKKWHSGAC